MLEREKKIIKWASSQPEFKGMINQLLALKKTNPNQFKASIDDLEGRMEASNPTPNRTKGEIKKDIESQWALIKAQKNVTDLLGEEKAIGNVGAGGISLLTDAQAYIHEIDIEVDNELAVAKLQVKELSKVIAKQKKLKRAYTLPEEEHTPISLQKLRSIEELIRKSESELVISKRVLRQFEGFSTRLMKSVTARLRVAMGIATPITKVRD